MIKSSTFNDSHIKTGEIMFEHQHGKARAGNEAQRRTIVVSIINKFKQYKLGSPFAK